MELSKVLRQLVSRHDPVKEAESKELYENLMYCLESISEDKRQILWLRLVEEKTYREVQAEMGLGSQESVRRLLSKAKRMFMLRFERLPTFSRIAGYVITEND